MCTVIIRSHPVASEIERGSFQLRPELLSIIEPSGRLKQKIRRATMNPTVFALVCVTPPSSPTLMNAAVSTETTSCHSGDKCVSNTTHARSSFLEQIAVGFFSFFSQCKQGQAAAVVTVIPPPLLLPPPFKCRADGTPVCRKPSCQQRTSWLTTEVYTNKYCTSISQCTTKAGREGTCR